MSAKLPEMTSAEIVKNSISVAVSTTDPENTGMVPWSVLEPYMFSMVDKVDGMMEAVYIKLPTETSEGVTWKAAYESEAASAASCISNLRSQITVLMQSNEILRLTQNITGN